METSSKEEKECSSLYPSAGVVTVVIFTTIRSFNDVLHEPVESIDMVHVGLVWPTDITSGCRNTLAVRG